MLAYQLGLFPLILLIAAIVLIAKSIKIVPQQHAWVLERLGRYHATLTPGLSIVVPFIDQGCAFDFVFLPEGEDPDSFVRVHGLEGFQTALGGAMPVQIGRAHV